MWRGVVDDKSVTHLFIEVAWNASFVIHALGVDLYLTSSGFSPIIAASWTYRDTVVAVYGYLEHSCAPLELYETCPVLRQLIRWWTSIQEERYRKKSGLIHILHNHVRICANETTETCYLSATASISTRNALLPTKTIASLDSTKPEPPFCNK